MVFVMDSSRNGSGSSTTKAEFINLSFFSAIEAFSQLSYSPILNLE